MGEGWLLTGEMAELIESGFEYHMRAAVRLPAEPHRRPRHDPLPAPRLSRQTSRRSTMTPAPPASTRKTASRFCSRPSFCSRWRPPLARRPPGMITRRPQLPIMLRGRHQQSLSHQNGLDLCNRKMQHISHYKSLKYGDPDSRRLGVTLKRLPDSAIKLRLCGKYGDARLLRQMRRL